MKHATRITMLRCVKAVIMMAFALAWIPVVCGVLGVGCRTAELDLPVGALPVAEAVTTNAVTPDVDDAALASTGEYRLSPGDRIDLQIYRETEISGAFGVTEAGAVRHPLCGAVPVAGLTVAEAEEKFESILGERYLVNPRVTIAVVSASSEHVVVLGEVAKPGMHDIPFGGSLTLLQAIAAAGGFSDLASVNRVTVHRQGNPDGAIRVRVSRLIDGDEQDLVLGPNDVIMVPKIRF
jgi:protein involved in polysaccharide export with SLBB domain